LGAGESGKSTLFKQMITIYGKGYSGQERAQYALSIHSSVISSMRTLCKQAEKYGGISATNTAAAAAFINDVKGEDEKLDPKSAQFIATLWQEAGIRKAYDNRSTFQLSDSCDYFFDRITELAKADYLPSYTDLLRVRIRTTGIVESEFEIEGTKFRMVDVGGQRTERKKWIHCFESVTAILFVAALSEYDQMLFEDETMNRMQEALVLFDEVLNSKWFDRASVVLFLNKRDLFQQKITRVPLKVCFPNYIGQNTYEATIPFLRAQFESRNKSKKLIYTHITCATDKDNVVKVFNSVKDTIIRLALGSAGLDI